MVGAAVEAGAPRVDRRRTRAVPAALLAIALLIAVAAITPRTSPLLRPGPPAATGAAAGSTASSWAQLSPLARLAISRGIGADEPSYWSVRAGAGLAARNPAQRLLLRYSERGVTVTAAAASLSLALRGARGDGHAITLRSARPSGAANRVSYDRGAITEWYANGPSGLEQGFTVSRSSATAARRSLTLALALHAGARLHTRLSAGGVDVLAGHRLALRYSGLDAVDATGRTLRAWMTLRGSSLALHVLTAGAHFPLLIDPIVQPGDARGRRRDWRRQPRTGGRRLGLADRRRGARRDGRRPVLGGRRVRVH